LAFFISSSHFTKKGAKRKRQIDAAYVEGGQRTAVQVLANGGFCSFVATLYLLFVGLEDKLIHFEVDRTASFLSIMFLATLACNNGDTWASELGVLSRSAPRLITNCRQVPAGTNGGVSAYGTLASVAGGAFVGLVDALTAALIHANDQPPASSASSGGPHQLVPLIVIGAFAGLFGSLIDSILGATLQYSGVDSLGRVVSDLPSSSSAASEAKHIAGVAILDNHQVNFVSSIISGLVVAFLAAQALP